jgi:polysaccharide export outer membrane protein
MHRMTRLPDFTSSCLSLALAGGLAFLAGGCGTPQPNLADPAGSPPAPPALSADTIRPGDKIEVLFTDVPPQDFPSIAQRVREDGSITLPLEVRVVAAGRKAGDLQDAIRAEYVPKYFKRLTVAVRLEERVFYVGGMVRRPDRYVFSGEMTLLSAIKVAGDFNEFAKKSDVKITRADGTEVVVDCTKAIKNAKFDVRVYPGDSIYVKQRTIW